MRKKEAAQTLRPRDEFTFRAMLAQCLVWYVNGRDGKGRPYPANRAFGWVLSWQKHWAEQLGGLPADWAGWTWQDEYFDPSPNSAPRVFFRTAMQMRDQRDTSPSALAEVDRYLNERLAPLEFATAWRSEGGAVRRLSIPRLDSPAACMAYVIGSAFMDLDGIGRCLKACQLVVKPDAPEDSFDHWPHYFVDIPLTKRVCCVPEHGNTYRQRLKRKNETARRRAAKSSLKARKHK